MGIDLGDIKRGASLAGRTVVAAGREAVGEVEDAARTLHNVARHAPDTLDTWKRLGQAAKTGERTLLPGHMPAYPELDGTQLAAAVARGQGRTFRMGFLRGEPTGGNAHEPVNIVVTGSKEKLARALRSQGWVENDQNGIVSYAKQFLAAVTRYDRVTEGPVSSMYLDGKPAAMAFSKNSDYNLARDHMRIYHLGKDPATGQDRWGIASTRDTAASVTIKKPEREGFWPWQWKMETPRFGHETDHDLDGERDLIMHDLIASKQVADWAAVRGLAPGAKVSKAPDGRLHVNQYVTDGNVYEVALG